MQSPSIFYCVNAKENRLLFIINIVAGYSNSSIGQHTVSCTIKLQVWCFACALFHLIIQIACYIKINKYKQIYLLPVVHKQIVEPTSEAKSSLIPSDKCIESRFR